MLLLLCCLSFGRAFSQSSPYVHGWTISPDASYLNNGRIEIDPNITFTLVFTVQATKPDLEVFTLPFSVFRHAKTGASNIDVSGGLKITNDDFKDGAVIINKEFTVNLTTASGASTTGTTIRTGDDIFIGYKDAWNSSSYSVVVANQIRENSISPPEVDIFDGSGDPGYIVGSTPTGGDGTYTYSWESNTVSATSTFTLIKGGAEAHDIGYNSPVITKTGYYRRIVTSGGLTSRSNVVKLTVANFIHGNVISTTSPQYFVTSVNPALAGTDASTVDNAAVTYQWQTSTTGKSDSFKDIADPLSRLRDYDPAEIRSTIFLSTYCQNDINQCSDQYK